MKIRRWTYLLLWGSTLLAILAKVPWLPLPGLGRFLLATAAMLANGPGVVVVGKCWGYLAARQIWGQLLAALLTSLMVEPLLRWIERPLSTNPAPEGELACTRRALLLGGSGMTGLTLISGYSWAIERKHFQLRSYRLTLAQLPPELAGLRVAVIADLHCGPVNRPGDLWPAIQMTNALKPDLILIPGDFVHVSGRYFSEAAELIAQLRPRIPQGLLLTWGNHDHWNGIETARAQLGPLALIQQRRLLTPTKDWEQQGPRGLWIAGVDDLWEGKPDLPGLLDDLPPDQPRLLLCHNPDVAELQRPQRLDLMLSGHTHGGQIAIPGLGTPILPSRYGQKYASGLVQGPHFPVYVNRGLGVGGIPLRLGVRPEITLLELQPGTPNFRPV